MAKIHTISIGLFVLGVLLLIANFISRPGQGRWFSDAGIFFILLSGVLAFYLARDQKAQIASHKEKIALHEAKIANQDAEIAGHKAQMADKDSQISNLKQVQVKSEDVPPLAKPDEQPIEPAIAPSNESKVEQITENK